MDRFARRLWYAKRGVVADDYNQVDWNMAGAQERQDARDEVERVMTAHIATVLDEAYRASDVLDATKYALTGDSKL